MPRELRKNSLGIAHRDVNFACYEGMQQMPYFPKNTAVGATFLNGGLDMTFKSSQIIPFIYLRKLKKS